MNQHHTFSFSVNLSPDHINTPERQPERKLWVRVLSQARDDYISNGKTQKPYWKYWLASSYFETICDWAGYHPEAVRRGFARSGV